MKGTLVAIHLHKEPARPLEPVSAARAIEGKGLEGDSYAANAGTFSAKPGTGRQITLVEEEEVERLRAETGIALEPGETRRNLTTRGVRLNDLVGRRFQIGEAVLEGKRLCEPCAHLASLTSEGVLAGLVHRAGLRADVVVGGIVRVGDAVEEA